MTPTTEKSNVHRTKALRIATDCHKMPGIDHQHTEAEMLMVREHSELKSAQYLARCREPGNVCHSTTTRATPERQRKETLYTRHRNTVEKNQMYTERGSEDHHWLLQDVQYRSPTHRSRDAKGKGLCCSPF